MNPLIKAKVEELDQLLSAEIAEQEKQANTGTQPKNRLAAFVCVTSIVETEEPVPVTEQAPVASPASDVKPEDQVEPETRTRVSLESSLSLLGQSDDIEMMLMNVCEREPVAERILSSIGNPFARIFHKLKTGK